MGPLEIQLNGVPSGEGFVIVSSGDAALPATFSLRTTDGSEGDVTLRSAPGSGSTLSLPSNPVHISGEPVEVQIVATSSSGAQNDTTIEVVEGGVVLDQFALTGIAA